MTKPGPAFRGAETEAEGKLVGAAQSGDLSARESLTRAYYRQVVDLCAFIVRDRELAEDLAQETFARALVKLHTFDLNQPFWPWLSTVARNICISYLRKKRRALEIHVGVNDDLERWTDPIRGTDDVIIDLDERDRNASRLRSAFSSLRKRDRRLVLAYLHDEAGYEKLPASEEVSVHAIRNSIWRARRKLRVELTASREESDRWALLPPLLGGCNRWVESMRHRLRRGGEFAASRFLEPSYCAVQNGLSVLLVSVASFGSGGFYQPPIPTVSSAPPISGALAGINPAPEPAPARRSTHGQVGSKDLVHRGTTPGVQPSGKLGPDSSHLGIQVVGPEGEVLYWNQTDLDCHEGGSSLTQNSPVRTVC